MHPALPTLAGRYGFAWRSPFVQMLGLIGIRDESSGVWVGEGILDARFGWWRVHTPVGNVASVEVGGPYKPWRAVGARLSLADRGLTFGTDPTSGVCIRFHHPVRGIDPWGLLRHPSLTVTVAQPHQLVQALSVPLAP